jgi:hypothetical protein
LPIHPDEGLLEARGGAVEARGEIVPVRGQTLDHLLDLTRLGVVQPGRGLLDGSQQGVGLFGGGPPDTEDLESLGIPDRRAQRLSRTDQVGVGLPGHLVPLLPVVGVVVDLLPLVGGRQQAVPGETELERRPVGGRQVLPFQQQVDGSLPVVRRRIGRGWRDRLRQAPVEALLHLVDVAQGGGVGVEGLAAQAEGTVY